MNPVLDFRLFTRPYPGSRINTIQTGFTGVGERAISGTNMSGFTNCVPNALYYMNTENFEYEQARYGTELCIQRRRVGAVGFQIEEILEYLDNQRYPEVVQHIHIDYLTGQEIQRIFHTIHHPLYLQPQEIAILLCRTADGTGGHVVNIFRTLFDPTLYVFDGQIYFQYVRSGGREGLYITTFEEYCQMRPAFVQFSTIVQSTQPLPFIRASERNIWIEHEIPGEGIPRGGPMEMVNNGGGKKNTRKKQRRRRLQKKKTRTTKK